MSERIAEAELRIAVDHAIRGEALTATQAGTYEMWAAIPGRRVVGVERLVAEVRRLRNLIGGSLPDIEEAGAWNLEGPIQQLRSEARAIREEQGLTEGRKI